MFRRNCAVLVIFVVTLALLPMTVFAATQADKDALLAELSAFMDKDPEIIRNVVYSMADGYSRDDKTDEAIALFEKALKVLPDNEDFLNRLGDLHNRKEDYVKVVEIYKKLTVAKPENIWYFQRLSDAYRSADKNDEAGAVWDGLIKISKNAEAFMQAANFYSSIEDLDKAIAAAKKAAELGTENTGYLQNLESLYVRAEKFSEAEAICADVLKSAKDEWMKGWANSELVNIYQRQDKLAELAVRFEGDLAASPNDLSQYKKLASLYQRNNQRDKATEVYEKAVNAGVADRDIDNELLYSYESAEDFDKAVAQMKKIMLAQPEDNYLYERLANLLTRAGKKDEAKKTWQEFLVKVPDDAGAASRYGDRLNEWGDVAGAIQQYKKAQAMDSNNLWYTMRVADLLIANERSAEARKELSSIIAKTTDDWMKQDAERKILEMDARSKEAAASAVVETKAVAPEQAEVVKAATPEATEEVKVAPEEEVKQEAAPEPKPKPKKKKKRGWFGR